MTGLKVDELDKKIILISLSDSIFMTKGCNAKRSIYKEFLKKFLSKNELIVKENEFKVINDALKFSIAKRERIKNTLLFERILDITQVKRLDQIYDELEYMYDLRKKFVNEDNAERGEAK